METHEKYQLQWMIEHNHSIDEMIQIVADIAFEELVNDGRYSNDKTVIEAFEIFCNERGFNGEIWKSEEDFYK